MTPLDELCTALAELLVEHPGLAENELRERIDAAILKGITQRPAWARDARTKTQLDRDIEELEVQRLLALTPTIYELLDRDIRFMKALRWARSQGEQS